MFPMESSEEEITRVKQFKLCESGGDFNVCSGRERFFDVTYRQQQERYQYTERDAFSCAKQERRSKMTSTLTKDINEFC